MFGFHPGLLYAKSKERPDEVCNLLGFLNAMLSSPWFVDDPKDGVDKVVWLRLRHRAFPNRGWRRVTLYFIGIDTAESELTSTEPKSTNHAEVVTIFYAERKSYDKYPKPSKDLILEVLKKDAACLQRPTMPNTS